MATKIEGTVNCVPDPPQQRLFLQTRQSVILSKNLTITCNHGGGGGSGVGEGIKRS